MHDYKQHNILGVVTRETKKEPDLDPFSISRRHRKRNES